LVKLLDLLFGEVLVGKVVVIEDKHGDNFPIASEDSQILPNQEAEDE
jgi:hypothetical protein